MILKLDKLNEVQAKEICDFKYEGEYSVYNFPSWSEISLQNWAISIEEVRDREFVSIVNEENNLCGFIRFINYDNYVLVGLGLNPTYCGQGLGEKVMILVKAECLARYGNKKISLEVKSFNKRAIKCYIKSGFKITDAYGKQTALGYDEFIKMDLVY
ncbi:MAG: GNAT family N-acetyltransferase [Clostridium sp.]